MKKNEKDIIPPQKNIGSSQFWLYNWQAIKYFPKDYSKVTLEFLKQCDSTIHLGSGSFMMDIAFFEKDLPVIFTIDVEFLWNFPVRPSLS